MSSFTKKVAPPVVARCADRFEAIECGVKVFEEPVHIAAIAGSCWPFAGLHAGEKLRLGRVDIARRQMQLHAPGPVRPTIPNAALAVVRAHSRFRNYYKHTVTTFTPAPSLVRP